MWLLKIEINGEWEECGFRTRKEALAAFLALLTDYKVRLKRAVLFSPPAHVSPENLQPAQESPVN